MSIHRVIALTLGFVLLAGCSGGDSARPAAAPQGTVKAPPPPPPPPPPSALKKTPPTPEATPAAPTVVQKKAEVGVGAKGRGYGSGPIATPAAAYFGMREKIVFDIQLPEAMNAYKAVEGRGPASHEEFMLKIIEGSQIKLPTLPAGERYQYDPKTEQLMVEKPAE